MSHGCKSAAVATMEFGLIFVWEKWPFSHRYLTYIGRLREIPHGEITDSGVG